MTQEEKLAVMKRALAEGLIRDPRWLETPDEPLPAWAILEVALKLIERLDPPYIGFD
jgi:hypothetical protein